MITAQFLQRQYTVSQFWKTVSLVSSYTNVTGQLGWALVHKLSLSVATGKQPTVVPRIWVLGGIFFCPFLL